MQIKIIEPGWEGFTGDFGGVPFANAVSQRPVTSIEAQRLANAVRIENVDTGLSPNSAQILLENLTTPMSADLVRDGQTGAISRGHAVKVYTRDELNAIADDKGIAGLRTIGQTLGVKSKSIPVLIDLILQAQSKAEGGEPDVPLLGSDLQPAQFEVDGKTVALGDVVRAAFERTGLSPTEWNEQLPEVREQAIADEVARLTAA